MKNSRTIRAAVFLAPLWALFHNETKNIWSVLLV